MWTPKEVRKLLAQIAGILFGLGGIALMISGVKATGKINISSNFISGEIESGSAGLLLLFFSFFLIILPSVYLKSGQTEVQKKASKKEAKSNSEKEGISDYLKILIVVIISTGLTFACFLGGKSLETNGHPSFGNFVIMGGYVFGVITGIILVASLFGFLFEGTETTESTSTDAKTDETKAK